MGILRLLLALSVVFAHSPWRNGDVIVGGRCAVQMFYMISGFLMSHILVTCGKYPKIHLFYLSRCLRIYPLYYVVAALTLLYALLHQHTFFHLYRDAPPSAALVLGITNITLFGQDWVMFLGILKNQLTFVTNFEKSDILLHRGLLVPQAWTLGLELTFYAMAPFVLHRRTTMAALLIFSVITRLFLFYIGIGATDPWTYRFFPAELSFFLVGALSNQILLPFCMKITAVDCWRWLPEAATIFALLFCGIYFLIPSDEEMKEFLLFGGLAAFLPLLFIFQNRFKWDQDIGDLSYPVYIGHLLVISLAAPVIDRLSGHDPFVVSTVSAGGAVLFAMALNKAIGHNIEKVRSRLSRPTALGS